MPETRRFKRPSVILLGTLAASILAEVVLRLAFGLGNPLLLQKDPDIGYVFRANQNIVRFGNRIQINRVHQRCDDFTNKPGPNVTRILVVGDSVTFGGTAVDQNETITAQLRTILHHDTGSPIEALNASAGSWGLGNELAYVERFGVFDSRWVVFQIGSRDFLQKKSTSDPVGVHPGMPDKRPLAAITEAWNRYLLPRVLPAMPSDQTGSGDGEEQFGRNMDYLFVALRLVRDAGAQPVILHTPERAEILQNGATNYLGWRDKFLAFADEEQVDVIDLYSAWKTRPEAASYFSDQVHLNKTGNLAVAHELAEYFQSHARQHSTVFRGGSLAADAPTTVTDLIATQDPLER